MAPRNPDKQGGNRPAKQGRSAGTGPRPDSPSRIKSVDDAFADVVEHLTKKHRIELQASGRLMLVQLFNETLGQYLLGREEANPPQDFWSDKNYQHLNTFVLKRVVKAIADALPKDRRLDGIDFGTVAREVMRDVGIRKECAEVLTNMPPENPPKPRRVKLERSPVCPKIGDETR